tara:strand:- start:599 stop:1063 length:465 start_codon:yes stop_codon:yes gene_type:complete
MLKKTSLLIIIFLLSSCGYEAMHSKKNVISYDFSISRINFEGDRDFNLKMKEKLNIYTLTKKNKDFTLNIKSISKKEIFAKDIKGDPTSFKNTVNMTIDVLIGNDIKKTLKIEESFNYTNNVDKFNLRKYEKEIKNNLAGSSANKLIFKLSNIQ